MDYSVNSYNICSLNSEVGNSHLGLSAAGGTRKQAATTAWGGPDVKEPGADPGSAPNFLCDHLFVLGL